jgi:predicted dehydrogenase
VKRRELLKRATALGAGSLVAAGARAGQAVAASDRIRVGMIGVGNFGTMNMRDFVANPDVEVVAVCDVWKTNLDKAVAATGGKARPYKEYRKLLEAKDIDAVVVTTPEQWHAIMAIDACDAGKDVYVEKPCAHHIREGRLMVDAARRGKRVVQVGSQQRSGAHFQRAVKYVQDGRIGDVFHVSTWTHMPAPTPKPPLTQAPPDLDWDAWLGPAPKMDYKQAMSGGGRPRFWSLWGGSLTEWGAHMADIVLWAMNVKGPDSVVATGAQFLRKDGEIPDTMQVTYAYPKFILQYSILQHNTYGFNGDAGAARFGSIGIQFHGSKGTLYIDRSGFRITPQPFRKEEANQPPPQPTSDSRQPGFYYTTEIQPEVSDTSQQHGPHVRNFLDCVKSRARPNADIEAGHTTNTVVRLGNIAYRTGRRIRWDQNKEQIIGDAEAQRLAVGSYRDPWRPKGL